MNKQRRKMTPEEIKEQDYQKELRSQKIPELKFALMLKHAKGQCEEILPSGRCPNKHGEPGVTIRGNIILTPFNGRKSILHCQKCGFERIKEKLSEPVRTRTTRKKTNPDQVVLV